MIKTPYSMASRRGLPIMIMMVSGSVAEMNVEMSLSVC